MHDNFTTNLAYPDDTDAMRIAVRALRAAQIVFQRPARHHLKIGRVNFWPDRGTIYCDGEQRAERERGLEALMSRVSSDWSLASARLESKIIEPFENDEAAVVPFEITIEKAEESPPWD